MSRLRDEMICECVCELSRYTGEWIFFSFYRRTFADLSVEAVMKYVLSAENCRSLILQSNSCAWTFSSCSPD